MRLLLVTALVAITASVKGRGLKFPIPRIHRARPGKPSSGVIHYLEEKYLRNVRQLTFGGANAEGYFSFDDRMVSFQSTSRGFKCDQIFAMDLNEDSNKVQLVSTGKGRTSCSFFYPDGERILYASTHKTEPECPPAPCDSPKDKYLKEKCEEGAYLWAVNPSFDIFVTNRTSGKMTDRLTIHYGYDAEGVVSPLGDRIAFTSMRTGDLEIWTMDPDGTNKRQITSEIGYDGGAFFSPDGQKLVWRASRPDSPEDIIDYYKLLESNVVSPLSMELFVGAADGSDRPQQITRLGGSNWAPYYFPDGERIIFSSNFNNTNTTGFFFNLYMIPESGNTDKLEQITFDPIFDSFPMFTHAEPWRLIWASARNSSKPGEINLFIADWAGDAPLSTVPTSGPTGKTGVPKSSAQPGTGGTTEEGGSTQSPYSTEPVTKGAGIAQALYSTLTLALAAVFRAH